MVVVNADLVWAHNNLFKGEGKEKMKDSRLARKLLEKPHSSVIPLDHCTAPWLLTYDGVGARVYHSTGQWTDKSPSSMPTTSSSSVLPNASVLFASCL